MQIKCKPRFTITTKMVKNLGLIEALKERVALLPMSPEILHSLRQSARLSSTHFSTKIEGNKLDQEQVFQVVEHKGHFPGRERDEHEVKAYYDALTQVERWAAQNVVITERIIKNLHALVMHHGSNRSDEYREGQNVIRDGLSGGIVYLPPEAQDVPGLMNGLIAWMKESVDMPRPILAGIVHYQFVTIHPYYDGNGRTARLLTTLLLHLGGYDLKGLYSLEEYYARNLGAYYDALSVGDSHNYYEGRAEADITGWIDYFVEGMAVAFENVVKRMQGAAQKGLPNQSALMRKLDPRQRKVLELFHDFAVVTSKQVGALFGFKPRTSASICSGWVKSGFFKIVDPSFKGRTYTLADEYHELLSYEKAQK